MTSEIYVVRHHGAWRTRIDGKHCGAYPSQEAAVHAAVTAAQEARRDAQVFSQGRLCQFHLEWQSGRPYGAPA